jgi:WD40 repeat protein
MRRLIMVVLLVIMTVGGASFTTAQERVPDRVPVALPPFDQLAPITSENVDKLRLLAVAGAGQVTDLAWIGPNRDHVAIAGDSGVWIYDPDEPHRPQIYLALSFDETLRASSDGKQLFLAGSKQVFEWDSGLLKPYTPPYSPFASSYIAAEFNLDPAFEYWIPYDNYEHFVFSPDGQWTAVWVYRGQPVSGRLEATKIYLFAWNPLTHENHLLFEGRPDGPPATQELVKWGHIVFNADGTEVALYEMSSTWTTREPCTITVLRWTVATGQPLPAYATPCVSDYLYNHALAVDYARDSFVALGQAENDTDPKQVSLGRLSTGEIDAIYTLPSAPDWTPREIARSEDGRYVALAGQNYGRGGERPVILVDLQQRQIAPFDRPAGPPIEQALFMPDNKRLITAGNEDNVQVWDIERRAWESTLDYPLRHFEQLGSYAARPLVFSPDGRTLIVKAWHNPGETVWYWDLETDTLRDLQELAGLQNESITAVAYHPDGDRLLVGTASGRIYILDAQTFAVQQELFHEKAIRALVFSKDGRLLVTAGSYTFRVWDTATYTVVNFLEQQCWLPVFSPDMQYLFCEKATWRIEDQGRLMSIWDNSQVDETNRQWRDRVVEAFGIEDDINHFLLASDYGQNEALVNLLSASWNVTVAVSERLIVESPQGGKGVIRFYGVLSD